MYIWCLQFWHEKLGTLKNLNPFLYPNIIEKIVDCKTRTMNRVKRFNVKTVSLHQMLGLDGINLFQYILITNSKSTVKKGRLMVAAWSLSSLFISCENTHVVAQSSTNKWPLNQLVLLFHITDWQAPKWQIATAQCYENLDRFQSLGHHVYFSIPE